MKKKENLFVSENSFVNSFVSLQVLIVAEE